MFHLSLVIQSLGVVKFSMKMVEYTVSNSRSALRLIFSTKNLIVKTVKSRRPPLSKEELGKLRFAVAKRFTVWVQKLENVVRDTRSWEERAHLWSDLVEGNRHHYAVH